MALNITLRNRFISAILIPSDVHLTSYGTHILTHWVLKLIWFSNHLTWFGSGGMRCVFVWACCQHWIGFYCLLIWFFLSTALTIADWPVRTLFLCYHFYFISFTIAQTHSNEFVLNDFVLVLSRALLWCVHSCSHFNEIILCDDIYVFDIYHHHHSAKGTFFSFSTFSNKHQTHSHTCVWYLLHLFCMCWCKKPTNTLNARIHAYFS